MSIANNMGELDTVAANNHPRGIEAASLLDDGIRSNSAILKQLGVLKNTTFSSGAITIGLEGGTYQCNPTTDISSILGGYPSGVFTLVFINSTAVNLTASSTIETPETIPVKVGTVLTVTKLSTGVFKVLSFNPNYTTLFNETGTRLDNIETKNTNQDNVLTSHTNSINTLAGKDYPHATAGSIGFNTTANNLVNVDALAIVLPENQFGIYQVVVRLDISTNVVNTFLKTVVDRKYLTGLPQPNTVTQSNCKFVAPQGSYNETVGEQSFLVSYASGQNNVMHIGFTDVVATGGDGGGAASGILAQYAVRLGA